MRNFYLLVFLISCNIALAQESWDDFSGEERAFLFHQARRVDILKPELLHLFEFQDSIPYINDTLPDYSYIEKKVVNSPELLHFHSDQTARKSPGILADLSIRYALWELDKVLQYRNSTDEADKPLKEKLKRFEKYVLEEVPQSAVKTLNNGDYTLAKTVQGYYTASLTVADKLAGILNAGYSQIDQMLILNAIMTAEEKYVHARSKEVFDALGGGGDKSYDFLSAVGDGRNWAEIIGGFNTPYTIGLPDEKGLFKFTIEEEVNEEKKKTNLKVKDVVAKNMKTHQNMSTYIHMDVFGYHPERQTTLAIQVGDKAYVLYGKNEHRLVSPDSTYGEGTTYWRLMNRLEHYYIANTKEDLYGKRGYEYQIDRYEKLIEGTLLKIKECEYHLDELRHTPEGKPKMKKKKRKKKNLGTSYQDGQGHPTSMMSKLDKKKNIAQNRLVQLNGLLDGQKAILAQLKEDYEKAYENLIKYEAKLDFMRKSIGYIMMEYEEENGVFTFKDGAKFIYATQDFIFPPNRSAESFRIVHISFGKDVFENDIDENFTHIHVSYKSQDDVYTLSRIKRDNGRPEITVSDSIQIYEVFEQLKRKKVKALLSVVGGGVVAENGGNVYRDTLGKLSEFDAESTPNFGLVKYKADLDVHLNMSVSVFDDPMIPGSFSKYKKDFDKLKAKYPLINEVDYYTAVRAKYEAEKWKELLISLANQWIKDGKDRKMVISKLKKMKVKKVQFLNGEFEAKVSDYES